MKRKKYSTSIRVSQQFIEELKMKIASGDNKKEKKSINKFLKSQLLEEKIISETDFFKLKKIVNSNLKEAGSKINHLTREVNSEKNIKYYELHKRLEEYFSLAYQLLSIDFILKKERKYKRLSDDGIKDRYISIHLNYEESLIVKEEAQKREMNLSEYIRFRIINSTKYTKMDVENLKFDLRNNIYRTINNLKQLIAGVGFIEKAPKDISNQLLRCINELTFIKYKMISYLEEVANGNNETYAH